MPMLANTLVRKDSLMCMQWLYNGILLHSGLNHPAWHFWLSSGYGMRSHPTEKLDYIKILTYYNLYLYSYFLFFITI